MVEVSSNAEMDFVVVANTIMLCSGGLRVLVTFGGQQNSKMWQIQISKISSTCKTLDIYCSLHLEYVPLW